MEEWAETHVPAHDLEDQEKGIVAALPQAANQAIPKVGTSVFTHKNGWFYNDRVRELKHRLIVLKKKLKWTKSKQESMSYDDSPQQD